MAKAPSRGRAKSPVFNRPVKDFAPTALEDKEPKPNFDLLDDETKESLRLKAAARVEAREKDRAMEAFLEAEIARIEKELHPEIFEEQREIQIDLAIYADRLIINGRHYMHGRKYTVGKGLYDCMMDIMARTRRHYADTHKDPNEALAAAQRAITKEGGHEFARISGGTGQVTRF